MRKSHTFLIWIFIVVSSLFTFEGHARLATGPQNCLAKEHWVIPHMRTRNGKTEAVKGHCRANPRGFKFWNARILKSRPRGWPHKQEKTIPWKTAEIEDILCELAKLPEELQLKKIRGIYRMERSKDKLNPASNGDRHIVVYSRAFNGKIPLAQIMAHELAHVTYDALSEEEKLSYQMATGWSDPKKYNLNLKGWIQRKNGYVRDSGKVSPNEDFANNIEYFLFFPEKLKTVTPSAHAWIKNHFHANFKLQEISCDK